MLNIYLSGEIHTDWRARIGEACSAVDLEIRFLSPVTDHACSDGCGVSILGAEVKKFWEDQKGAGINAIRSQIMIEQADVVIVRFGDKYRQWNAAFDAGYAHALGTPIISLHDPELNHPLKEVDGAALAVAETPEQIAAILQYVLEGKL